MAIYRIFRERVFEPEAVICMAKAYEGALVALQLSDRHDPLTELVAKKIVEIAETGERDHARIRDRALEELRGNAAPRTPGTALSDDRLIARSSLDEAGRTMDSGRGSPKHLSVDNSWAQVARIKPKH